MNPDHAEAQQSCPQYIRRLDMDNAQYPAHEPRGNGPPGSRKEAYTEPNADQVNVDGGGHIEFSRQ
jgi:hypothetical protein